jgi:serine/threonine protein phosphatase PrpC
LFSAFGVSDAGPVRKTNEDRFAADERLQLMVVADGMGGHLAGDVASSLAVDTITGFVRRSDEEGEYSWPYGIDPHLSFCSNRLRTAIHLANRRVFRAAEKYDDYTGMGTTVVCALLSGNQLSIGHAGDSRLYVLAQGQLTQLTTDDTWEATLLAGAQERASSRPAGHLKHVLTNVLGAQESAVIHMREFELQGGETLFLCSDGLHNVVDDGELGRILAMEDPLPDIGARLIEAALARGTRDNVTAVLGRYHGA